MGSTTALVDAASVGDLPKVMALLKDGADIEGTARDGLTPLDAAAKAGHMEVVKYLLDAGAAVNSPPDAVRTALGLAVVYEHTDCAQYLLSRGGQLRGTQDWKRGLMEALKRDNKMELYQLVKDNLEKNGGGS